MPVMSISWNASLPISRLPISLVPVRVPQVRAVPFGLLTLAWLPRACRRLRFSSRLANSNSRLANSPLPDIDARRRRLLSRRRAGRACGCGRQADPALFVGLARGDSRARRYTRRGADLDPWLSQLARHFEQAAPVDQPERAADFALAAAAGARENAKKDGFKIVYDKTYPPGTPDFTPIVRAIEATSPDIVYVASYPPDSVGIVKAAHEVGLKAKMFGGGMVGLQFAGIQKNLGPMLDNIVNYHFWVPAKTLNFPGINEFLKKYEVAAKGKGVDPLGQYLPPYAYAYMQVLGQAIEATHGMDQAKLAAYMHKHTFSTVAGKVKFGSNGEWAHTRVLMTQFRNVKPNDLDQFRKPGTQVVLYPRQWKSGKMVYPFNK